MLIPPYRITLSGGGLKGIAHIGALEVLSERGLLKSLREYVGISAGALVALCLCIGCSLSELRMVISLLDFGLIRDLDPETMLSFPETFGFDSGANLEKLLKTILRARRLSPTITFEELAALKLGPRLRVIAMNLNTCLPEDFSAIKTPKSEVCMAVRASMSIPIYFAPVKDPITHHYLSDGGIYFASPFKFLAVEEREHTLSIAFNHTHKQRDMIENMPDFLYQLYYCLDFQTARRLAELWGHNIIHITCKKTNIINFEATQEEKTELMESGRSSAEEFLQAGMGRSIRRRNSF